MGKILEHRKSALKSLHMASYLLITTYPLLKEPKTLLTISNHVFSSFMSSVSQLLAYERSKRTIPPYHDNNESKLNSFRQYLAKKHGFGEYLEVIDRINTVEKDHENSSVEFSKDKKFIICSDQYKNIDVISEEDIKNYINKAKEFLKKVNEVVSNE